MSDCQSDLVTVVIFEGGQESSSVEAEMAAVRQAFLLDNISKLKSSPLVGDIFLLTNYPDLAREGESLGARSFVNHISPAEFSFGRELQKIIKENLLKHLFYLGGGGGPLLTVEEINDICHRLLTADKAIFSNNSQSADLVAFTPASLLLQISPPATDNVLAVELQNGSGIDQILIPPSLGTFFDLDTPADLLVMAATSWAGPHARESLAAASLDIDDILKARMVLAGDYEEILLIGRIGAPVIAKMNLYLKARLRVFSEERGMKALGRLKNKEVVSFIGYFLDEVGIEKFFSYISSTAACAFIDSRVIFAHKKLEPTVEDRFNSDLGRWQGIKDSFVREFTRAAVEAPVPIILGGHSLVSGGLWALTEDIGPQFGKSVVKGV